MKPPGHHYRLANLLGDRDGVTYETGISNRLRQPSEKVFGPAGSDATFLPTATFCRDLGLQTGALGGNLVSAGIEAVAAAARPQLLLERLGAQRLEVSQTGPINLPIWQAGSGAWVADGAAPAASAATVRSITASGKMAAARIALSRRLQLQAADLEQVVLNEISAAVADTIESGFLAANGSSNKPLGLLFTPGAGSQAYASATPSYSELADQIGKYAAADGVLERACWLMHPNTAVALLKQEIAANTGNMLAVISGTNRQPSALGIPAYTSRHIPTGKVLLTDPSQIVTIYWGAPQLIVDRFSNGKSASGAAELILFNLCDIAVLHPAHLIIGSN